jgi:hypothetical protein
MKNKLLRLNLRRKKQGEGNRKLGATNSRNDSASCCQSAVQHFVCLCVCVCVIGDLRLRRTLLARVCVCALAAGVHLPRAKRFTRFDCHVERAQIRNWPVLEIMQESFLVKDVSSDWKS